MWFRDMMLLMLFLLNANNIQSTNKTSGRKLVNLVIDGERVLFYFYFLFHFCNVLHLGATLSPLAWGRDHKSTQQRNPFLIKKHKNAENINHKALTGFHRCTRPREQKLHIQCSSSDLQHSLHPYPVASPNISICRKTIKNL